MDRYEQMLRADNAERALRERERALARVLAMLDAWESEFGGAKINTDVAVAALRRTIRGVEFAP